MWCPRCHTEVAAEIAQNGQSLNCTSCGTEIQRIYAPSLHPDTRSARELLARWSKGEVLEGASDAALAALGEAAIPPATTPLPEANPLPPLSSAPLAKSEIPAAASSSPPSEETSGDAATGRRDRPDRTKPERSTPKPRTTWRVDAAHTVTQPAAPLPPPVPPKRPHFSTVAGDAVGVDKEKLPSAEAPPAPAVPRTPEPIRAAAPERFVSERAEVARLHDGEQSEPVRPAAPRAATPISAKQHRLDPGHETLNGPHFDLQSFLTQDARKPGRSESIWGQVLAYAGVGLITVGTTLVLWSWFGKAPQYAPTGWLVCTVGQMLLFLGVTTLISGGMQQTSHEVTRRVEYLGDRILRFEQSADQILRGPHFNESRDRAKAKAGVAHTVEDDELDA